jgi:hypothetical protein
MVMLALSGCGGGKSEPGVMNPVMTSKFCGCGHGGAAIFFLLGRVACGRCYMAATGVLDGRTLR